MFQGKVIEARELTPLEKSKREALRRNKPLVYEKVMQYDAKQDRGESVAIIQFQWKYVCNFSCDHCSVTPFRQDKRQRVLTLDDAADLSDQAHAMGLGHIDITGGETTVFPDLDELVAALRPERYWLQADTNGWLMDDDKALHFKEIGLDKIHLSIDSLYPDVHDAFRGRRGSWQRAVRAIDSIKNAGLGLHVCTVATHDRAVSGELEKFIAFINGKGAEVSLMFPKLIGEWKGRLDLLMTDEDIAYLADLEKSYHVYNHMTNTYGRDVGCIAVKRMISVNRYGDIMPGPCMQLKIGNFFEEPLKRIIERGMRYFKNKSNTCITSQDGPFIRRYVKATEGRELPIPIEEVFGRGDA